jgi:hypothetical protein
MRIIITKKGEEIRLDMINSKKIEEEKKSNIYKNYSPLNFYSTNYNNSINIKKFKSNSTTNIKNNYNSIKTNYLTKINNYDNKENKKIILNKMNLSQIKKNFFNRDELNINLTEMAQSIPIKIKKSNIKLSNAMEEKYSDSSQKIKKIRYSLQGKNFIETKILPNLVKKNKNMLKISEILTPKNINKFKLNYYKDENEKYKNYFSTKNLFRYSYEFDDIKEKKINKFFNKKISFNRINLINYIKNKENISTIFMKKINELDDEKMYRLNNVCRNYFIKNEIEEKSIKNLIEKKSLEKNKKIKLNFSKSLKIIEKNFDSEKKLFDEFDKKYNVAQTLNKKFYENKFKHYWKKYYTGDNNRLTENNSDFLNNFNNSKEQYLNNNKIILFDN